MPELELSLSANQHIVSTVNKEKIWVAIDQSGTWRKLQDVRSRSMQKPLDEAFARYLYEDIVNGKNSSRVQNLIEGSTAIYRDLPVNVEAPIDNSPEREEFKTDILGSEIRTEQEMGLLRLSSNPNVAFTLVSAMPAEGAAWAWLGLGEIGRALVHPKRQMILRRGPNSFVTKLAEYMIIKYGLDLPEDERILPEKVFGIEDDINLARLISRYLHIPMLVPISFKQEAQYPYLPIPKVLEGEDEEVYVGSGLPELNEDLLVYLRGGIPESRFNAFQFLTGNAVELRGLHLEDFIERRSEISERSPTAY